MRVITMVVLIALAWGGFVLAETATPELLFQKALHMETARGDYRGAIPVYEEILKTQEQNAVWAAKALYRMGLCCEKIGDQKKAGECARSIEDKYSSLLPENADMQNFTRKYCKQGPAQKRREKLKQKLETIEIPQLEFNNALITEVIKFLYEFSVASDTNSPANDRGVNFILNLGHAVSNDVTITESGVLCDSNIPRVTLSLRNVSLADVIKYITENTGLKYRLDDNAVVIMPADAMYGELDTRTYKVEPSVGETLASFNQPNALMKFMSDAGIPFPEGCSIEYQPGMNLLIVKNTDDNLNRIERLLTVMAPPPSMQIKVDAQLIELTGEQASAIMNKQNITRADLEKIPTNHIRYMSRLTVVAKNGSGAEAKDTRPLRISPGIGSASSVSSNQLPSETEYEIGAILAVNVAIGADDHTIDLMCDWQSSELLGWTNVPGKSVSQPVIGTKSVVSNFQLYDGQSMVMQVQREPDATGGTGADSKQYLLIVTAILVDPRGNAIEKKELSPMDSRGKSGDAGGKP